jgi:hypothetical protein
LANQTSCSAVTSPQPIVVYDSSGTIAYRPASTGRGFSEAGLPCTGFVLPGSTGRASCPIAFDVTWMPRCFGTCVNPSSTLDFRGYYNSSDPSINVNPNKYDTVGMPPTIPPSPIIRGNTVTQKTIVLKDLNGGACGGGMANRRLTLIEDPFGLVTTPGVGGNALFFRLAGPMAIGVYKCSITANSFQGIDFQVQVVMNGTVVGTGAGYAPTGTQSTATFEATLNVTTVPAVIRLQQSCSGGGATFGRMVLPNSVSATMICTKGD